MMDDRIGRGVVVGLTARSWRRLHKKGKGCRENRVQAESESRRLNEEWVTSDCQLPAALSIHTLK